MDWARTTSGHLQAAAIDLFIASRRVACRSDAQPTQYLTSAEYNMLSPAFHRYMCAHELCTTTTIAAKPHCCNGPFSTTYFYLHTCMFDNLTKLMVSLSSALSGVTILALPNWAISISQFTKQHWLKKGTNGHRSSTLIRLTWWMLALLLRFA